MRLATFVQKESFLLENLLEKVENFLEEANIIETEVLYGETGKPHCHCLIDEIDGKIFRKWPGIVQIHYGITKSQAERIRENLRKTHKVVIPAKHRKETVQSQ